MKSVKLLKPYKGHESGEIIEVDPTLALKLVSKDIARFATTRDFLVKPRFGDAKSFNKSPKIK